jgi:lysozyme
MKGIDVSVYQPNIDESKVAAAGVAFCLVQLTQGRGYANPIDHDQSVHMQAAGIKVGYYHFGHPERNAAADEAAFFLSQIRRQDIPTADLIPALDIEQSYDANGHLLPVPSGTLEKWVNDFAAAMAAGGFPQIMIYSNAYYLQANLPATHGLGRFPLWLAAYVSNEPAPAQGWSAIAIWQDNGKATIDGIPEPVDTNQCDDLTPLLLTV